MANRKAPAKSSASAPRTSIADLEKRLKALERRVAILEAKQPTLAEKMSETTPAGRRIDLGQNQ